MTKSSPDNLISRRQFSVAVCATLLAQNVSAHTPFQQWVVYRQKHLLIGASKTDDESYQLGKRLAEIFKEHIPNSKSRVARAPNQNRLASLITTDQMLLVLLREDEANDLRSGAGLFEDYAPFDLKLIAKIENHVLTASPLLLEHHAWLIAETLAKQGLLKHAVSLAQNVPVPLHDGARAYFSGDPMPQSPKVVQTADTQSLE